MKTNPPSNSVPSGIPCFECEEGTLQPSLQDYATHHPKLGDITIPAVPMLRCDHCGDTVLGEAGNTHIDAWLEKALHAISPEEVQAFLSKYHLTQKEASRIAGLGEKNMSR